MPTAGPNGRRPAASPEARSDGAARPGRTVKSPAPAPRRAPTASRAARPSEVPDAAVQRERETILNALRPVTELLATVVGSNVEVVLHDLTRPERSIVAITNGHISGRCIGSSILSGPKGDKGFASAHQALSVRGQPTHSIIDGYNTVTSAGQPLRSTTALYRDSRGEPFAALCINADLTVVQMAHAWLGRMLEATRDAQPPRPPDDAPQVDALIEDIIGDAVSRFGKPVQVMSKEEKIHAVEAMLERGLFMVRGGVERAAAALHVTRFTVYNYLDALRTRHGSASALPANGDDARAAVTGRKQGRRP